MTQHKAPTAVTIAPTREKTGLNLWLERYWKVGAGLILVVVAWILYQSHAASAKKEMGQKGWSKLLAVVSQDPSTGVLAGAPDDLKRVGSELEGTPEGAWALYLGATSAAARREFDQAGELLAELRNKYPNSTVVTFQVGSGADSESRPLVVQLEERIKAQQAFIRDHPGLFDNPPLPADAPRVRLTTDRGVVVVGLYSDLCPKLVENFVKLARDGAYNGTKFHSIVNGEYIRGGDPNSIAGEAPTWGKGGPGYTFDREPTALRHFTGVISAVPDAEDQSKISGSQFLLTSGDMHTLDDTYSPFGKVLEGLEIVRELSRSPLVENSFTQPQNPATIVSAEVL